MNNIELAKEALSHLTDTSFYCSVHASEGGRCGDSWCDEVEIDISQSELLYLIIGNDETLIPDGMSVSEYNLEDELYNMAYYAAWPDGKTEEFDSWEAGGESEALDNYIDAWNCILNEIDEGTITEDNLDDALQYFEDEEYPLETYEEWRNDDEFFDE